jgi:hypothetical protein
MKPLVAISVHDNEIAWRIIASAFIEMMNVPIT